MTTSDAAAKPCNPNHLRIKVTSEHIATAIPLDSGHCMIADAVKADLPYARSVQVDIATIRFTDPQAGKRYLYLTPPSVQAALLSFDAGIKPDPFIFRLSTPAQITPYGREYKQAGGQKKYGVEKTTSNPKEVPARIGGKRPASAILSSGGRGRTRRYGFRQIGKVESIINRIDEREATEES